MALEGGPSSASAHAMLFFLHFCSHHAADNMLECWQVEGQRVCLNNREQQSKAVKDLLERELLQSAIEHLNNRPVARARFPLDMFGMPGHKMLSRKTWLVNPWHALCCVVLLTGNDVEVKCQSRNLPDGKRARPSPLYVTIRAPKSQHGQLQPSVALSSHAPRVQRRYQRLTQIALTRDVPAQRWDFQVHASRVLTPCGRGQKSLQPLRVGLEAEKDRLADGLEPLEDDKCYESCRTCWSKDGIEPDGSSNCYMCAGEFCAHTICNSCAAVNLSQIERLRLQNRDWVCETCQKRGR